MLSQQKIQDRLANLINNNKKVLDAGILPQSYIQVAISSRSRSKIWVHSGKLIINNKKFAKCNYCDFKFQMRNTATNFMRRHLQKQHKIQLSQHLVSSNLNKSIEQMIAKLASINLKTFLQISQMSVIQKLLKNQASPSTISQIVKKVYQRARLHVRQLLSKRFEHKFTLSVDSCQIQSRKFWNIFVYNQKICYQLPMVRQKQYQNPNNLKKSMMKWFQSMCIQPKQINKFIMNTKSKLIQIAQKLGWYPQRCLVHMLYTTVDTILFGYERDKFKNCIDYQISESQDQQNSQNQINGQQGIFKQISVQNQQKSVFDKMQKQKYKKILQKCRKIISLVKYYISEQNFDQTQKQTHSMLYLIVDQKKRWPMTYLMIKYFLNQFTLINKVLLAYNSSILVTQQEILDLYQLKQLLQQPFKTIKNLQKQSCTIVDADIYLNNLTLFLFQQKSNISQMIYRSLRLSYQILRNNQIICCGIFLMSPNYYRLYRQKCFFKTMKEHDIRQFIQAHFNQLDLQKVEQNNYRLNLFQLTFQKLYNNSNIFNEFLKSDLIFLQQNGIKSQNLKKIQEQIKKTPFLTINSRRYFTPLNQLIDNYRVNLSDETLISLNYLNWYFRILKKEIL